MRAEHARLRAPSETQAFTRGWWVLAIVAAMAAGVGGWFRVGADDAPVIIPVVTVATLVLIVVINVLLWRHNRPAGSAQ